MVDLMYSLTNLIYFNILLLYYYINLISSIIYCLSSGEIYILLGILLSVFCEAFAILSEILLTIKSPVTYDVFCIDLFEATFNASLLEFLALSRSF